MSWLSGLGKRDSVLAGLHIDVLGDGAETLVFIPGLGGTTRYWKTGVEKLEDRYRIVLLDLLGFGESPKPWTQYSVERQLQELRAVLEPLGQITLIGHSLGALLTVAYAARYPSDIQQIVLIGMPYFGSQLQAYRYLQRGPVKGGYLFTNVIFAVVACVLTRRLFGWLLPYFVRSVPREVAEDLVKHTWRSSTSSLWEVVYRYDAGPDLDHLPEHIVVLFIHGSSDLMAPVAAVERLIAEHPQWHLHILSGIDHHPFLRQPDVCLNLITAKQAEP